MPMLTSHIDSPTPSISQCGSLTTIRWDSGLAIQLDHDEWAALLDAISTTDFNCADRALHRDEDEIRSAATIREGMQ